MSTIKNPLVDVAPAVELAGPVGYEVLASRSRRVALDALDDASLPLALHELAEALATDERVSESDSDRIACTLHHCDLPKMDEAGLLKYDPNEKVIGNVEYP